MENDSIKAASQRQAKDSLITTLAAKQDFIDSDVVVKLTRDNLQWNGTGFTVVDDSGQPHVAADGVTPLTPEQFYAEYAASRIYFVKVRLSLAVVELIRWYSTACIGATLAVCAGVGGHPLIGRHLKYEIPAEYKRLRQEAVKQGLVG